MRILISNDDGVTAPGLSALAGAVADLGEISIIAPHGAQSATAHRITLIDPIVVRETHVQTTAGPVEALAVEGSPADCVRLAIRNLLPQPPQLVLAGINAGVNVGFNVFYSGTVAVAGEAAMWSVPSVAFSAWADGDIDWARAGELCRRVLDVLLAAGLPAGGHSARGILNVNLPQPKPGWPRGVRICRQSRSRINDVYEAAGRDAYQLAAEYCFEAPEENSDAALLEEGFITVTPLRMDLTDQSGLAALKDVTWPTMS